MRRSSRLHFATVIACGCGGALSARFSFCRLKLEMSSVAKSHFVLLMASSVYNKQHKFLRNSCVTA